jgi:type VI secretion system protein ImpF
MPPASDLDRFQPCLFDRLIDPKPKEQVESRAERLISMARYREAVIRDIEWLLSTSGHLGSEGLEDFPAVEQSVFNFGRYGLEGVTLSNFDPGMLEEDIARALRRFEPRINPATVKVRCVSNSSGEGKKRSRMPGAYNVLTVEISGELWAHPASEDFLLKTSIDMETGGKPG